MCGASAPLTERQGRGVVHIGVEVNRHVLHVAAPKVAQIRLAPLLCGKRLDDNINLGWERMMEGQGEQAKGGAVGEKTLSSAGLVFPCAYLGEPGFNGGLRAARLAVRWCRRRTS